jgi:hypothetical protein
LLAIFALGAISANAVAQAETLEWGTCYQTPHRSGGRYANSGCTDKAESKAGSHLGRYEWERRDGKVSLSHLEATGAITFETGAGETIQCASFGFESEEVGLGPRAMSTPLWELEGCESEGQPCQSSFAFAGEINDLYAWYEEGEPTPGWAGTLGFVSGKGTSSPVVGVEVEVKNDERLFEPIVCEGAIGTVWIGGSKKGSDSFISTMAPVNEMTDEFTWKYSESAPGVPDPTSFEGKKPVYLEAFLKGHWEPVAMTATFHNTGPAEGAGEIKATK